VDEDVFTWLLAGMDTPSAMNNNNSASANGSAAASSSSIQQPLVVPFTPIDLGPSLNTLSSSTGLHPGFTWADALNGSLNDSLMDPRQSVIPDHGASRCLCAQLVRT